MKNRLTILYPSGSWYSSISHFGKDEKTIIDYLNSIGFRTYYNNRNEVVVCKNLADVFYELGKKFNPKQYDANGFYKPI